MNIIDLKMNEFLNQPKTFLETYQIPHEISSDLQKEAMSQIGYILTLIASVACLVLE